MSADRLKFYRDAGCTVPAKSFNFGKLDVGEELDADFYLKNLGFVAIDDVKLKAVPTGDKITVKLNTPSRIKRLGAQEVYFGQVHIRAKESAKAGAASFDVDVEGRISEET